MKTRFGSKIFWDNVYDLLDDFSEKKEDYSHSAFKEELEECFSLYVAEQMNRKFTDDQHEKITEIALMWNH